MDKRLPQHPLKDLRVSLFFFLICLSLRPYILLLAEVTYVYQLDFSDCCVDGHQRLS